MTYLLSTPQCLHCIMMFIERVRALTADSPFDPSDASCMSPRDFGHQGIWSRRIYNSHPDMAVDCWVRTDPLDADLALCLQRFQDQGGELNPEATAYLEEFLGMDGETASRDMRVHPSTYERPCEYFFPLGSAERAAINEVGEPACSLLAGGCDCCIAAVSTHRGRYEMAESLPGGAFRMHQQDSPQML